MKAMEILYGEHTREHTRVISNTHGDGSMEADFFQARVKAWPGTELCYDESQDGQPLVFFDLAICEGPYEGEKVKVCLRIEGLGEEKYYAAVAAFGGAAVHPVSERTQRFISYEKWLSDGLEKYSVMVDIEDHPALGLWVDCFISNSAEPL